MKYHDFELSVEAHSGSEYRVAVLRSPAGASAHHTSSLSIPLEQLRTLATTLLFAGASLASGDHALEAQAQDVGKVLFDFLFAGDAGSLLERSRGKIGQDGLRIMLRIAPPELAELPWEMAYDRRGGDFLCLRRSTALVRHSQLADQLPQVLPARLNVLGVIASPSDREQLDAVQERERLERALADSQRFHVEWIERATWSELSDRLRPGGATDWHVVHFIGHGGFDGVRQAGYVELLQRDGTADLVPAIHFTRIVREHAALRLIVLNSCQGSQASRGNATASVAAMLVQQGVPAVIAMQYAITDAASVEFAARFYSAVAKGDPVEAAVAEARNAVAHVRRATCEWAVPTLTSRVSDGRLFTAAPAPEERVPAPAPPGRTARRWLVPAIAAGIAALGALAVASLPSPASVADRPKSLAKLVIVPYRAAGSNESAILGAIRHAIETRSHGQIAVVPEREVRVGENESGAIGVASEVGASALVTADLSPAPDGAVSTILSLYDPRRAAQVRTSRATLSPSAIDTAHVSALVDSLLKGMSHYTRALAVLDRTGDLFGAAGLLDSALTIAPDFAPAHIWRAQVGSWGLEAGYGSKAQTGLRFRLLLSRHDSLMAVALTQLELRQYSAACSTYAELLNLNRDDEVALIGRAKCLFRNDSVRQSSASRSGWEFITSRHEATTALMHAVKSRPHFASWWTYPAISGFVATDRQTMRTAANGPYQAYPEILAETLAYIPFAASLQVSAPTTWLAALAHGRTIDSTFVQIWMTHDSVGAAEPWAGWLEGAFHIGQAIKTLEWMRRRAPGQPPTVSMATSRFQLALKDTAFEYAARLADSIFDHWHLARTALDNGNEAEAAALAGAALVTGRIDLAARLQSMRMLSLGNVFFNSPETNVAVARHWAYSALGVCGPLMTQTRDEVSRRIRALDSARRDSATEQYLTIPARFSLECFGLDSSRGGRTSTDHVILAERALARGHRQRTIQILDSVARTRSGIREADITLDVVFPEAWLRAAAGDTGKAIALIDLALDLEQQNRGLLGNVLLAGSLLRTVKFRIQLAEARGETDIARRWTNRLRLLWQHAEPKTRAAITPLTTTP